MNPTFAHLCLYIAVWALNESNIRTLEFHARDPFMMMLCPLVSLYQYDSSAPVSVAPKLVLGQIPSAAFGDGSHPTTRLCAGAVDSLCRLQ